MVWTVAPPQGAGSGLQEPQLASLFLLGKDGWFVAQKAASFPSSSDWVSLLHGLLSYLCQRGTNVSLKEKTHC